MTNHILSLILLGICVVGIVAYGALAPWYRSIIGWSIMGLFVSLGLATAALASLYVFGRYPYRAEVFTGVYVLLILVVGSIVAYIIRSQFLGRRARR